LRLCGKHLLLPKFIFEKDKTDLLINSVRIIFVCILAGFSAYFFYFFRVRSIIIRSYASQKKIPIFLAHLPYLIRLEYWHNLVGAQFNNYRRCFSDRAKPFADVHSVDGVL
jgi:hypothetical protein